ncbi:ADP-ribosylglycohydrolase family protein [Deinococcus apachensis]|uniref:ADP-ribosylglycohydrolase family protein n=1 Tax=Deinococcus apachensis TaxID=309886 RepID=UPI0004757E4D|nr:ADP-ribosylglycohydrolase family protein [Deinococcus apachensis]
MLTPPDYLERVYAGVLGKMIGVYLGRPVEGWSHERITATFGELDRYVHEHRGWPLVLPDDDLTGTFTFPRALPEHGNRFDLTPADIGETWLNHIVEGRTCLWWGGFGNSTEQTAYLRLKAGVPAPESGSIERNGRTIAEQIGAQIFIDGWAMVTPGDPQRAASLARRAASVSHDGEAVHAAVALAAMEALSFMETDLERLLDVALEVIPGDSMIARLHRDLRGWHQEEPDWRAARARLQEHYGYDRFPGNVHVVPNHGVIVLALLYGDGDFHRTLTIANTCGWDTDCNSGNVGCLLALRGGLAALTGNPDWRGPLADRLYLPGAEGGRAITDALTVAVEVTNIGRALAGEEPLAPKGGAKFHFSAPGAVQGFVGEGLDLENVSGHSRLGERSLTLRFRPGQGSTGRAMTRTFLPPGVPEPPNVPYARGAGGGWNYTLLASPSLYPGQQVQAEVEASTDNPEPVSVRLCLRYYDAGDMCEFQHGPLTSLAPGERAILEWQVPDLGGLPVAEVGVELESRSPGTVYLDSLDWSGAPDVTLGRPGPPGEGTMWRRAWVNAVEQQDARAPEPYRLLQNRGVGLISQGSRDWTNYAVEADLTVQVALAAGLVARFQGLRRHYALVLVPGALRLVKTCGGERVLAEAACAWSFSETHRLRLEVQGGRLRGLLDGTPLLEAHDEAEPLLEGGVALLVEEGWLSSGPVRVEPL